MAGIGAVINRSIKVLTEQSQRITPPSKIVYFSKLDRSNRTSHYHNLVDSYLHFEVCLSSLTDFVDNVCPDMIQFFTNRCENIISNPVYTILESQDQIFADFRSVIYKNHLYKIWIENDDREAKRDNVLFLLTLLERISFKNSIVASLQSTSHPLDGNIIQLIDTKLKRTAKNDVQFHLGRLLEYLIFGSTEMFFIYVADHKDRKLGAFVYYYYRENAHDILQLKQSLKKTFVDIQTELKKSAFDIESEVKKMGEPATSIRKDFPELDRCLKKVHQNIMNRMFREDFEPIKREYFDEIEPLILELYEGSNASRQNAILTVVNDYLINTIPERWNIGDLRTALADK